MRAQCSISLNKDPSLNKLPNIPTAFSLAVSHSDPYTHDTLPTHPLPFPRKAPEQGVRNVDEGITGEPYRGRRSPLYLAVGV